MKPSAISAIKNVSKCNRHQPKKPKVTKFSRLLFWIF